MYKCFVYNAGRKNPEYSGWSRIPRVNGTINPDRSSFEINRANISEREFLDGAEKLNLDSGKYVGVVINAGQYVNCPASVYFFEVRKEGITVHNPNE